ncbi:uncharacterized protein BX664DRAFT_338106 [Halteromyces radiatus]|uniref:uncharacterized protein n=1 Tax=Halteromyces radiatus TaxID=101107 RepID=UPI00221E47D1|nr:uncharacterized protein BX664DRAFT_338106 [Halteromyces radiatus]KAI8084918.1 hypothetical protein BX664DRAFT_338106 [Halteromyces radiatus]
MRFNQKNIQDSFSIPQKRSTRFSKKKEDMPSPTQDQLIAPKKRQRITSDKKKELHKLFDSISADPFYENDIPIAKSEQSSDKDSLEHSKELERQQLKYIFTPEQWLDWIYDQDDSDTETDDAIDATDDLAKLATEFLEKEETEELKQALNGTEHVKEKIQHYRFFSKRCTIPSPQVLSIQDEINLMNDKSMIAKYNHLVKYSADNSKRKFLISSDIITTWYQLGWNCTHSVYQWLIEIVAFEEDIGVARQAFTTLSVLWSNWLQQKLPLAAGTMDGLNYNRFMSVDTFSYILRSYGALSLLSLNDDDTTFSSCFNKEKDQDIAMDDDQVDKIPLIQFEWVLELLTKSLTLWPEAYTVQQLHYLGKTLICLGVDQLGMLLLNRIQDTLEACLQALPEDDWQTQIQKMALSLGELFTSVELQIRIFKSTKPICDRSLYLRRVMAVLALEMALNSDKALMEQQEPKAVSLESLSSICDSSDTILSTMTEKMRDTTSIFQQTNPDYRQLSLRIYLLDHAIGSNISEFKTSIDAVSSLVTQLQALGRRIGGRLSTLERTMANEATQRLWSRMAYVIGRYGNTLEDHEL